MAALDWASAKAGGGWELANFIRLYLGTISIHPWDPGVPPMFE